MESSMFKPLSQIRTLAAACLLAAGASAVAQTEDAADEAEAAASGPDTSEWLCEDCPVFEGLTGNILFGAGYVSDDFFDFGNYRGLEEQGAFGAFGVDLLYRDADARYLGVYGEKLGLDSRTLLIEGGRQGRYDAWLEYDEIAHFRSEDTRTIFLGAGTANQELPADWVRGDTTTGMTELDASLRGIDIKQDRKTLRLGFSGLGLSGLGFNAREEDPWRYRLEVERTKRDGNLIRGASFIFRAAELAAPIDYETTQFDAAVGFVQDRWELELAYNLSLFDNSNRSVRWQNPFLGIFDADVGELAEPPDNRFHQFMLSGSWRQSRWLALAGQVAVGRMEQDEQFLAPTLNARFLDVGVPRSNLDGEVDTRIVNLRATSNVTRYLSARLRFHYDERDNDTPRDPFVQVVSDTFLTDERVNEPFSFERTSVKGELDYRFTSFLRLSASAERKEMERDFQEVRDTETDIYTAGARLNPGSRLNLNLELRREERDNDLDPALLGPQENPSLRRFHFAEKNMDSVRLVADYALLDNVIAGFFLEIADEDFSDTEIGLSDARSESYGVDLSASFSDQVSAHAFFAWESLDADISGADSITGAQWQARQEDDFRTAGFGLNFHDLPGKWVRAALDLTYASADGEIAIEKFDESAPDFPRLKTGRFTLEASLERMVRENLNLRLGYLVGKLSEDDFFRDNVAPDTVPTLLSLGEGAPDGTVHVISAMLRYTFQ